MVYMYRTSFFYWSFGFLVKGGGGFVGLWNGICQKSVSVAGRYLLSWSAARMVCPMDLPNIEIKEWVSEGWM